MNSYMAMLTAIALVLALIADLTLLPALLIILDRRKLSGAPADKTKETSRTQAPNPAS